MQKNKPNLLEIYLSENHNRLPELIKKYHAAGQDDVINQADSAGQTLLHLAVEEGDVSLVRLLLEHKADANKATNDGSTPLHYIAFLEGEHALTGQEVSRLTDLLIQHNADVNKRDHSGETPLMGAVQTSNIALINQLIKAGADVNIPDNNGKKAIDYISQNIPTETKAEISDILNSAQSSNTLKKTLEKAEEKNETAPVHTPAKSR